ncbi:MAG TPA: HD domain-containing protein [Candidatus Acidoferrales bacterium]|nr:HD domain-containing protein [Candidatus Acidoferrales bacterium]
MNVIKDTVHGFIRLDDLAISLMDTHEMQRLRRVKQLGFANLVYPGANHTRFEHSLGVLHLAELLLNKLDADVLKDIKDEIRAASLIHDVGHMPLSHSIESVLVEKYGKGHEYFTIGGGLLEVINQFGLDKVLIEQLIRGESQFSQIISSDVDVDRMDYIVRDEYYTGVAYGAVDCMRLIEEMDFINGQLVISEGGIQAVESLLVSRFLMFPTVYFHHVSRIAEAMVRRAITPVVKRGVELWNFDDYELLSIMMREGGYSQEIASSLLDRRLFKRALYASTRSLSVQRIAELESAQEELECEIACKAGLDERYVLLDIPRKPEMVERNAKVLANGSLKSLEEVSRLVGILYDAQFDQLKLGVYTLKEHREKVGKVAKEVLDVK